MKRSASTFFRGFTLIEALVALLVLTVGVLGLAAMQINAMKGAHVSYQRTVATFAAQDAVERLWLELGRQVVEESGSIDCPTLNFSDWHAVWKEKLKTLDDLDVGLISSPTSNCEYTISISWADDRFLSEEVSELAYVVRIFGE